MTTYARLVEHNEHEGEAWGFYIPIEGNEEALGRLARLVTALNGDDEDENYKLERDPIDEVAVDALVRYGNDYGPTYMPAHTKLVGKLVIPEDALRVASEGDDDLYKGSIRNWIK